VDTPYPWELNIWYQTLNAGFRTRISGETDFPCIYSERVGLGRSHVKLGKKWTHEDWCEGMGAKPILTSRRSIEWCLKSVDQCWRNKEQGRRTHPGEGRV
jgi:hypothetical protein